MANKDRFVLEQEIMNCWSIIDDLEILLDKWDTVNDDEKLNIIIGIKSLYKLKFDTMFSTFETVMLDRSKFINAAKNLQERKVSPYEQALNDEYGQDLINNRKSTYQYQRKTTENEY